MYDALIGWVGLTVLVLASALSLATDVARQRATDRPSSPPIWWRRRGVQLFVATTFLVAAGLAITAVRILALL